MGIVAKCLDIQRPDRLMSCLLDFFLIVKVYYTHIYYTVAQSGNARISVNFLNSVPNRLTISWGSSTRFESVATPNSTYIGIICPKSSIYPI